MVPFASLRRSLPRALGIMETTDTSKLEVFYRDGVAHALGGFQLLEQGLKMYIDVYYKAVRVLLGDRLYFGFQHSEIKDAPLGQLVKVFGKTCANTQLVEELRSVIKHRDNSAHQAFLCLYGEKPSHDVFIRTIDENLRIANQLTVLLARVHEEAIKVLAVLEIENKPAIGGSI